MFLFGFPTRFSSSNYDLCYQYIDDLNVFNNKKFGDCVKEIYPSQLTVEKANTSDDLANYLDLTFIIRYARCCSYYDDFGYCQNLFVDRLLSHGYKSETPEKFIQKILWQIS